MQTLIFYVSAASTLGTVRDYANAKSGALPILTRAVGTILKMRVFSSLDTPEAYPLTELLGIPSWQWVMDTDFDSSTNYILVADHDRISVSNATEIINGKEYKFTEFTIPIPQMNTEELCALLETKESVATLNGELIGYDTDGAEVFVLQVKGFTVRNRISSTGNPTELPEEYLNESQVRALLSSGMELIFAETSSENAEDWHSEQNAADRFFRVRLNGDSRIWIEGSAENSGWSDPILIPSGKDGENGDDGTSDYCYIRYASNSDGADFSATPSDSLKYRAEIHSNTEIINVTADLFAGMWVKYIGDNGADGKPGEPGSVGITLGIIKSYDPETGTATVQEANDDWTENPDGTIHENMVVP